MLNEPYKISNNDPIRRIEVNTEYSDDERKAIIWWIILPEKKKDKLRKKDFYTVVEILKIYIENCN